MLLHTCVHVLDCDNVHDVNERFLREQYYEKRDCVS